MKKILICLTFHCLILNAAATSKADLLGDSIQFDYAFPSSDISVFDEEIIVVAGAADEAEFAFGEDSFFVNPESDFIEFRIDFPNLVGFAEEEFNGAVISDLDFSGNQSLAGITFETDFAEFSADRISFTGDSLAVNFEGLSVTTGDNFLRVNLITVPEPSSFVCLLCSIGLLLRNRQRG